MSFVRKFRRGAKFPLPSTSYKDGEVAGAISFDGFAQPSPPSTLAANMVLRVDGSADMRGEMVGAATGSIVIGGSADLRPPEWVATNPSSVIAAWYLGTMHNAWAISNGGQVIACAVEDSKTHGKSAVGITTNRALTSQWINIKPQVGIAWRQMAMSGDGATLYLISSTYADKLTNTGAVIPGFSLPYTIERIACDDSGLAVIGISNAGGIGRACVSTDGGSSWVSETVELLYGQAISSDGLVAYFSTAGKLYKGLPGSLVEVTIPAAINSDSLSTNGDGSVVWFMSGATVYRSVNGGSTWSSVPTNGDTKYRAHFVAHEDAAILCYTYSNNFTTGEAYIWRTILTQDGGATWRRVLPDLLNLHKPSRSHNGRRWLAYAQDSWPMTYKSIHTLDL